MARKVNHVGISFNMLTVVGKSNRRSHNGRSVWIVKCECKNVIEIPVDQIYIRKSCGCKAVKHRNYVHVDPLITLYKKLIKRHKPYKGELISFDLFTYLSNDSCFYCSNPPKNFFRGTIYQGLDRVDNTLGYINGNVVSCCYPCNSFKADFTKEDFIAHAKQITAHQLHQESLVDLIELKI